MPPVEALLVVLDALDGEQIESIAAKNFDFGVTQGELYLSIIKRMVAEEGRKRAGAVP